MLMDNVWKLPGVNDSSVIMLVTERNLPRSRMSNAIVIFVEGTYDEECFTQEEISNLVSVHADEITSAQDSAITRIKEDGPADLFKKGVKYAYHSYQTNKTEYANVWSQPGELLNMVKFGSSIPVHRQYKWWHFWETGHDERYVSDTKTFSPESYHQIKDRAEREQKHKSIGVYDRERKTAYIQNLSVY